MRFSRTLLAIPLCFSLCGWVRSEEPAKAPAAQTVADVKVAVAELDLLLTPLTQKELMVEADAWLGLLKAKAQQISAAEIQALKATGEAKDKLLTQASALRDERTQITDRLKAVLAALKAKGGKSDDYDLYIASVSGLKLDVTDAGATWTKVVTWAKSAEGGIRYAKNIILFIVTLIVFKILAGLVGNLTRKAVSGFKNTSELLRDFLANVVRKITMFIGLVVALSMLEVNIGPLLAAMGAAGFIVGFALQGTLSNFASGVMILLYRPYDIGETITVGGNKGKVTAMTMVSTMLANDQNHTVIIPNSAIWNGTITNHGKPAAA